jgi:Sterol desaturase
MLRENISLSVQTWAIQQLAFHAAGLIFEYCDHTSAIRGLKVRDPDRKSYYQMLPRVLFNQCFVLLPCMVLAQQSGYCFTGPLHLPLWQFLLSLPIMAVGHDLVQYLTHRYLLHNPNIRLMRTLGHSLHHTTTASRGISACYMSSADFLLEIVLPYLIPLALVGGGAMDHRFHFLVAGAGAIGGVYEHSGYDLAVWFRSAASSSKLSSSLVTQISQSLLQVVGTLVDNRAHGEHHSRGNVSFSDGFGSPGLCDTLFGTRWDLKSSQRESVEKEWRAQRQGWDR